MPSLRTPILTLILTSALLAAPALPARETIVGLPCDGCEHIFAGLPDSLTAQARIAPEGSAGEALRITGTVRDRTGQPMPGIVVYAYHTDPGGIYPRASTQHGALRGWARSDDQGRYRFDSIRPGGYPGEDLPQHVHMLVLEPGRCTYYLDDVLFTDDPRLTTAYRERLIGRGGSGVITPQRDEHGVWLVERDIELGRNIRGYDACEK